MLLAVKVLESMNSFGDIVLDQILRLGRLERHNPPNPERIGAEEPS